MERSAGCKTNVKEVQEMKDIGFGDSIIDEAYRIAITSCDDEGNLDLEKIEKGFLELRSRPHPAPPEPEITWEMLNCAMDRAATKAARTAREQENKRVLDSIMSFVPTLVFHLASDRVKFDHKIQSLRQPNQEQP